MAVFLRRSLSLRPAPTRLSKAKHAAAVRSATLKDTHLMYFLFICSVRSEDRRAAIGESIPA